MAAGGAAAYLKQPENVFEELIKALKDPVDFDLPSALKEWKLGYYVPIKRNVYLTKTKKRVKDDGIFCSCTLSIGSSVACEKDCQCGMLFSCCSSNCRCENKCANKAFQHRPLKKTKLITTEKCGFGLVVEDEIKKGEFVIEYVGEVIDDRTCEERLWKMKRQRYTNFYLCEVEERGGKAGDDAVVPVPCESWGGEELLSTRGGERKQNQVVVPTSSKYVPFVYSDSIRTPVATSKTKIYHPLSTRTVLYPIREFEDRTVDGETRVGIFALRDIKKGEELTYDYKFVQFGADQDCHCGSSNCRKMVGASKLVNSIVLHNGNSGSSQDQHDVKKRQTTADNCIGEIIRLWDRRDKMYVPAVVYDYDEYTGMHTLLLEEETTEKFDMREEDWDFLPRPEDPDED